LPPHVNLSHRDSWTAQLQVVLTISLHPSRPTRGLLCSLMKRVGVIAVLGLTLIVSLYSVIPPADKKCLDRQSCEGFSNVVTRRTISFKVTETSVTNLAYSTRYGELTPQPQNATLSVTPTPFIHLLSACVSYFPVQQASIGPSTCM